MRRHFGQCPVTAVAGLGIVLCLSFLPLPAIAGQTPSSTAVSPKRWAQFELVSTEEDGSVQAGKDVVLSLTLGGLPSGTESVMAIIESAGFQSQTVSLSEDATPAVYQGTAILEPNSTLKSRTTVHPKAVRVRVSFARAKITGLEEFLKRDFYVTLGDRPPERKPKYPRATRGKSRSRPGGGAEGDGASARRQRDHCRGRSVAFASTRRIQSVLETGQRFDQPELEPANTVHSPLAQQRDGARAFQNVCEWCGATDPTGEKLGRARRERCRTADHHPCPPVSSDPARCGRRYRRCACADAYWGESRDPRCADDGGQKIVQTCRAPLTERRSRTERFYKGVAMTNRTGRAMAMLCLGASVLLNAAYTSAETARYDVDPDHSIVEFKVAHMVISKTTGHFKDYTGFIEMDPDAGTVKAIDATIKTASVTTNQEKRDTHLRNPDFFDVEKYPTMVYKMKSYKKSGDGYTAIGDLTLHGVTKEMTLTGNLNGVTKDPWGNTRAGFTAEGKVNRKDFRHGLEQCAGRRRAHRRRRGIDQARHRVY